MSKATFDGKHPRQFLDLLKRSIPSRDQDTAIVEAHSQLNAVDMVADVERLMVEWRAMLAANPIPRQTRVLQIWVIGHGPDYPISFTGFERIPLPIHKEYVEESGASEGLAGFEDWNVEEHEDLIAESVMSPDTFDRWEELPPLMRPGWKGGKDKGGPLLGAETWDGGACLESDFLKALFVYTDSVLEEEDDEELDEFRADAIFNYGNNVFPWLILENRAALLSNTPELYIVFGFHGEGDSLIMGHLTRDSWTPIQDLLKASKNKAR